MPNILNNNKLDIFKSEILNIYNENFPYFLRDSSFRKQIHAYNYYDLLINNNYKLMGFAFLNFFRKYNLIHLDYIALDKSHQGGGNGTQYLKKIINEFYLCSDKNYLTLECENHLIKFYEKNGFQRIKLNYLYKGHLMNLMIYNNKKIKLSVLNKIACYLQSIFTEIILSIILLYVTMIYFFIYYKCFMIEQFKYHILDCYK